MNFTETEYATGYARGVSLAQTDAKLGIRNLAFDIEEMRALAQMARSRSERAYLLGVARGYRCALPPEEIVRTGRCRCTVDCEFPCWQRVGIAPACEGCGCPPFTSYERREDDCA